MVEPSKAEPSADDSSASAVYPTLSDSEVERLLALVHRDPHSLLGAHPVGAGGVIVRAFKPEAEQVELLISDEPSRLLNRIHPAGLFELLLEDHTDTFTYQLRISYAGGSAFTTRDPY